MSLGTIKSECEQYLNTNVTDKALKWVNTAVFTKNGVVLSETEIRALSEFISPMIIPISEDKEVFGNVDGYKYEAFFQMSIYTKVNSGTGGIYDTIEMLNLLFKEKKINDVVVDGTETLTSIIDNEWLVTPFRIKVHTYSS